MLIRQKREIISATKNLYIFNPEHDLVLAVGRGPYTPPAEVLKLRREKSLLPALYADNGDFILIDKGLSPQHLPSLLFYPVVKKKKLNLITVSQLQEFSCQFKNIIPWGWDFSIRNTLIENGIPLSLVPSDLNINKIRDLSHRRTTVSFRNHIAKNLNQEVYLPGKELFTIAEVEEFIAENPVSFLKAPWSSSGRGLIVSDHISYKGLIEWSHGTIRRQGSLLAEPAWNKSFDFATEWKIEKGEPRFLGYSVFEASSRGKYHGNIKASQHDLVKIINQKAPAFNNNVLEAQKKALYEIIGPYYEGYLGIDMLSDTEGRINSCVEINIRLTMGHVEILREKYDCNSR